MGLGGGNNKGKGHFSGQICQKGKGHGAKENSREAIKILGGLVRNRCRPLGHAHRTMGVQDPLCNAAPTEISGTGDHIPQGVLKWSSLNQSVQELRNKGAIEPAPLTPGFYSRLFLATKATGEWRPIIDLSSLMCLRALPELHYGDASVNPRGPTTGPVVNIPRLERCLLSYRDQPSRQTLLTLLSQRHRMADSQCCHLGCQPVREYLPKYSNRY